MMFGFNQKKAIKRRGGTLLAVISGTVIAMEEVPDEVFAQKMLGDGYAIEPSCGQERSVVTVLSPCDGVIIEIQDSLHAYGIETTDGVQILVHIGINTVALKGEGFCAKVKKGDSVKAGMAIATVDLALLQKQGYPTHTIVLITEMDKIEKTEHLLSSTPQKTVHAGEEPMLQYTLKT